MLETRPISELFRKELEADHEYAEWSSQMRALASFLADYEYLKDLHKYTQAEVASRSGTNQSAISRLSRLKGKPTYDLLRRISSAVGGDLFVTPLGKYSVTLNYEHFGIAEKIASEKSMEVPELLEEILQDYFNSVSVVGSCHEFTNSNSNKSKTEVMDPRVWRQDSTSIEIDSNQFELDDYLDVVSF